MLHKVLRFVSKLTSGGQMKLVLVVRSDLRMSKGKTAAQCSHASILCYQSSQQRNAKTLSAWCRCGQPKIVLKVDSLDEILHLQNEAHKVGIVAELVKDAGRTQLVAGTATVLGIGPDETGRIDQIVRHLKLL